MGATDQHIPLDTTIGPQFDIYSVGVLAFQLLFSFDFIKNFQMSGRDFKMIPETEPIEPHLLDFMSLATEPSVLYRFKSARQAKEFLVNPKATQNLVEERYNLPHYFEFYYKSMRDVFKSAVLP